MVSVKAIWSSKRVRQGAGVLAVGLLLLTLVGALGYAFLKALNIIEIKRFESVAGPIVADDEISQALDTAKNVVASGAIVDSTGKAIPGATVKLSAFTPEGQLVWSTNSQTNEKGIFTFRESQIPIVKDIYGAVLSAEAPGYLADKKNVTVEIEKTAPPADRQAGTQQAGTQQAGTQRAGTQQAGTQQTGPQQAGTQIAGQSSASPQPRKLKITPSLNRISLTPYNPWLALVVLIPAIFGLLFAILHLARFTLGIWVTYLYAFGTAALWSIVVAELVAVYAARGNALIPLFWSDLFVSSGVIVFAFIGSIVYVAYAMHDKEGSFVDDDLKTRRKILLNLGGRVLVAPYIAMTAYGIFAATFPTVRTGPFAAFFGFFTGLWIKPVLDILNDIGMRLLSAESAQKVADRAKRTDVPDAPEMQSSRAADKKPDQAFLDAVTEARKELLQKESVIGVAPGFKLVGPGADASTSAIIVYVYEKSDAIDENHRVPPTFHGFRTDVVALPPAGPDTICHSNRTKLSWAKIHQDNVNRIKAIAPVPTEAAAHQVPNTQIVLIVDQDKTLFNDNAGSPQRVLFDAIGAYQVIRHSLGDHYDFISFAIDKASNLPEIGDYHVPVFSDITGINYEREGNPGAFSERSAWGSGDSPAPSRLRACFVRSLEPFDSYYRYLHELGHYWCAYVTFKDRNDNARDSDELLDIRNSDPDQRLCHWGLQFDDGRSPMDYDRVQWSANMNGSFAKEVVPDEQNQIKYCQLDLYLMGLIPSHGVDPFRILRTTDPTELVINNVVKATPVEVTIDDVIKSCGGTRNPPAGAQTSFSQAMVVVSRDNSLGEKFAKDLEVFRVKYQAEFHSATGKLGTLDTTIRPKA